MEAVSQQEQKNKRYGMIISVIFHTLILVLFILPFLTYPDPPPGQEGILVNLGIPDIGQGDENAGPSQPVAEADVQPEEESEPTPVRETRETPSESTPQEDIVRTEDPDAIALQKQRQEEARKRAEEEARKRAEADARRKAAEEQARREAEAEKFKKQMAEGFSDSGTGTGKTNTSGTGGSEDGAPDQDNLGKLSTGAGAVGGGLGDRGVAGKGPGVKDNSQSVGDAVIRVCVDKAGNVVSAEFTQKGSSITDGNLKNKAIADARRWKFAPGDVDKQCGTITYRFRVQ